jgi:hypothetical protein
MIGWLWQLLRALWHTLCGRSNTTRWIIIAEPSPFRRDETVVVGPLPRWKALRHARRYVSRCPFGQARVVPESCEVSQGESKLWPPPEPDAGMHYSQAPW